MYIIVVFLFIHQVELEKKLCDSLTDMQSSVAPRPLSKHSITEDEMRNLHELSQVSSTTPGPNPN